MEKLNKGDKIYLDKDETKESEVNGFLACRDGVVTMYEYHDSSGYGSKTRLFLCRDVKHETIAIVRQTYIRFTEEWAEESMHFDLDSFVYLEAIINRKEDEAGATFSLVRDY